MMRLTRRYRFAASHRLHLDSLSDAENQALYGKCNNPYGHGHNYVLEVSVSGPVDPQSGQLVSVEALDDLVHSRLIAKLDNSNLNFDPTFRTTAPTTENLLLESRRILERAWPSAFPGGRPRLEGMRLLETRKNSVELAP